MSIDQFLLKGGYEIAIMCTYFIKLTIVWRKFYVLKFALINFWVIFHAFYLFIFFIFCCLLKFFKIIVSQKIFQQRYRRIQRKTEVLLVKF